MSVFPSFPVRSSIQSRIKRARQKVAYIKGDAARALGLKPVEGWSLAQVRFAHAARTAARRALFYTRLLENDADADLVTHILAKATDQLNAQVVPDSSHWYGNHQADGRNYSGARRDFDSLAKLWQRMGRTRVPNPAVALTPEQVAEYRTRIRRLDERLVRFLSASLPQNVVIRITYARLPALSQLLRHHAGYLLGLVIAIGGCMIVEVRSLLLNQPLFGVAAWLFAGLIPAAIIYRLQSHRRKTGTPFWDKGGNVVRSIAPCVQKPEPWIDYHPRQGSSKKILGLSFGFTGLVQCGVAVKIVTYLAFWSFFLMAYLVAAWFEPAFAVGVTVYLIAAVLSFIVLIGWAVDFLDLHSQAPVRALILTGLLGLVLVVLVSDRALWSIAFLVAWVAIIAWWSLQLKQKLIPVLTVIGALLLTVSVTSYRKQGDFWRSGTAAVEPALRETEWPWGGPDGPPIVVLAASGGGSRAAILTAKTLLALERDHPQVTENLQVISSVSGGSLAAAAYITRRLGIKPPCADNLHQSMQADFLRPTLLGVVIPFGGGRGRRIQRAWENCPVGLRQIRIDNLSRRWRDTARRKQQMVPFPVPIFNSVTLDRHAVVITPLSRSFFTTPVDEHARTPINSYSQIAGRPTWVYYRSGIYHIDDLLRDTAPTLSAAVRASANFPFGFPLVDVRTRLPLWYSPRTLDRDTVEKIVHLTDGGALSNSGMWSLTRLLLNQPDTVRKRGVLLIIVDAGRMPSVGTTGRQLGLLGTILDRAPKGERLHWEMLAHLQKEYGSCFAAVQIDLTPDMDSNVYTTWALDDGSIAKLNAGFEATWARIGPRIGQRFNQLDACRLDDFTRDPSHPTTTRVPLS